MASNQTASARIDVLTINKESAATLSEGAVCAFGTDFDKVTTPTGAAAIGLCGIVCNAGGVVSGDRTDVQVAGVANVLVAASTTVNQGKEAISAASTGTVKEWTSETAVDVIGIFMETRVVGGTASLVPVLLRPYRRP